MRKTWILFIIFGWLTICWAEDTTFLNGQMVITNGAGDTQLTLDKLVDSLIDADAIFVGEIHNDSLTHAVEYELLKLIYQKQDKVAIALEMFERDVQKAMNRYLSGDITEDEFLKVSRPWGNYQKAYRPLVEFAREKDLPVLAMNIPRRYARRVAMMGEMGVTALSDSEKVWVAAELKALDDEYKKRFMDQMGTSRPGPMAKIDPENLYRAQCIKDDTMAESIFQFIQERPGVKVVSFQGDFHSAFSLGIVKKLKLLKPSIKTVVVSVIPVDDINNVDAVSHKDRGDFLIFVQRFIQK